MTIAIIAEKLNKPLTRVIKSLRQPMRYTLMNRHGKHLVAKLSQYFIVTPTLVGLPLKFFALYSSVWEQSSRNSVTLTHTSLRTPSSSSQPLKVMSLHIKDSVPPVWVTWKLSRAVV